MGEETLNMQSLNDLVQAQLDQVGTLRENPDLPKDNPLNTGRAVVRGVMRPILMYFLDQGVNINKLKTPEEIITQAAIRPELNLPEDLVNELSLYGEARDWRLEALAMSIALDAHPLHQLSRAVKEKLSKSASAELTRVELQSR